MPDPKGLQKSLSFLLIASVSHLKNTPKCWCCIIFSKNCL